MTEKSERTGRTRIKRTASGQIAPFTRRSELVSFVSEQIAASQAETYTQFPSNDTLGKMFEASENTILRTIRDAALSEQVKETRKITTSRRLAKRDQEIVTLYSTALEKKADDTHPLDIPLITTTADKYEIDRSIVTNALKNGGIFTDVKKALQEQAQEKTKQNDLERERQKKAKDAQRDQTKVQNDEARNKQDQKVAAFFTDALTKLASGETSNLPTIINAADVLGIKRWDVADSLKRTGLATTVRQTTNSLTKGAKATEILQNQIDTGKLTSYPDIATKIDANPTTVYKAARKKGLQSSLREAREKKPTFVPSQETAWILGMLVGAGSVIKSRKYGPHTITFTNRDPYIRQAFKNSGERIFETHGFETERADKNTKSVVFHTTAYATALGNFFRQERAYTIRKKHGWVLHPTYIDSFTSGVFDARGHLIVTEDKKRVTFYTTHREIADAYRRMLIGLGIKYAKIIKNPSAPNEVKGVAISNIKDLKIFAEHIRSVNPHTQELLDSLRDLPSITKPKQKTSITSLKEIRDEWKKLTASLGHPPLSTDISKLRRTNDTLFPVSVYIRYFGKTHESPQGKFSIASERLTNEDIL